MPYVLRRLGFAALLVCAAALLSVPAHAQTIYEAPANAGDRITLQWSKPSFNEERSALAFVSSSLFLSGRFTVADNIRIVGEVPVGIAKYDDRAPTSQQTTTADIGNPYVGVEFTNDPAYVLEAGLRLPIVSLESFDSSRNASGAFVGFFTQQNRPFAFQPESVTVHVMNSIRTESEDQPIEFRGRVGAVVAFPTDDQVYGGQGRQSFSQINGSIWLTQEIIQVGIGFTNWFFLSASGDAASRSYSDVGVSVFAQLAGVEPGLSVRIPLDSDTSSISPYTFSLMMRFPF